MIKKIIGKAVTTFAGREDFEIPQHDSPLFAGIDWERLPRHVAVIMDGNGRWGKEQGVMRTAGHSAGVKTLKNILKTAIGLNLDALTVYAFSTENWKRPETEVNFLMNLFYDSLKRELQELHEDNVQIRFVGRLDKLPASLQAQMRDAEELMKNNTGVKFNVAINYGGQDELVRVMQKIAADVQAGKVAPEAIDEAMIEQQLDTVGNLPVDLVIRTSGDMRLSNFLLWQSAYAELYFTDVNWPEFSPECFVEAMKDFASRDRRFGGLNDNKK
ncbi:undecaprenyl diphosphate synthase [Selenomonas ruminantium]|uniref:Isoprenyl transferase n=1 Tax=Selenomonas ruminantium TaxID=971 RepID=A0A1M6QYP2_SELRU|nr:isoprenyl transferase [Selenomonas ruminantium]SHK25208.1 undecaprenyl diphosphate synthase [Selenomonas ruminantium]